MNRYNQYPTMPCACAKVHKTESRYAQNYNSSDTDEYDYSQKNISFPRSDYSARSCHRYDNSPMLDEQALSALTSLRQKACKFITSETEDTLTDSPAYQAPCSYPRPHECRSGGPNLLRRANDMIDYAPQSEFLKKMKQQCQLMTPDEPSVYFDLDDDLDDACFDYQESRSSPRTEERIRYKSPPTRLPDAYNEEMLYKNSAYDPHCSTDEKLLDQLIDKKIPSGQDVEESKKPDKKSVHISRSKKPVKCRGRRKRKSGSAEKCESEDQFEPTLKRPHENSCERCWRFASPSRSPVNKPDQKYDPNFRRGHSCYDFERGDGEFYDRHISPCKDLQPVTSRSREKQEASPAASVTFKTPVVQPVPSTWQRSPEGRPLTATSSGVKRSDGQSRSSTRVKSPEGQVRRVGSVGRKSPEVQTQTAASYQRSPEGQTQMASSYQRSPEGQTQMASSYQRSPEGQTQMACSYQRSPEGQTQMASSYQRSPGQTQMASSYQRSPEGQTQMASSYQRSPEGYTQTASTARQKSPVTQPQTPFSSSCQRSPDAQAPQTPFSSTWPRSSEVQPFSDSSVLRSSDDRPQKSFSIWHRSPESLPPQTYASINVPRTPEAQPQTPFSTNVSRPSEVQPPSDYSCLRSSDDRPQKSFSIWHRSPVSLPPQTYASISVPRTPEAQPQTPFSTNVSRLPEVQPLSDSSSCLRSPDGRPQKSYSIWHRTPPAPQFQTPISSNWPRPPEIVPPSDSSLLRSSDDKPQKSYSIWHRSPEPPPPFTPFTSNWPRPPEVQPLSDSSSCLRSPDGRPRKSYSIWHRSPPEVPPPQTPSPSTWQRPPEVQQPLSDSSSCLRSPDGRPRKSYSIWQRPPENRPQMYPPEAQPPQRSFIQQRSPMQPGNQDFPPENYGYSSMPLPERNVSGGQPLDRSGRPTCAVPQGVLYSDPRQSSRQKSYIPGVSLADIKRCSEGIDDLNLTEYKTIAIRPREEFYESANTSLPDRSYGHMTQSTVGESMHSPRPISPPRPCPIGLGTIPEAADSDSSKSKYGLNQGKSSKSVRMNSSKSPIREETSKADTTKQSNGSSPKKKSKSPRRSPNGGSPNKTPKSPHRSGNGSPRKCKSKSPSPKPGSSKQEIAKSPQKSPRKSPNSETKRIKSLENVKSTKPPTPEQRPQSSDPRVREPNLRRDRINFQEQYQGLDHEVRNCTCGPESSFAHDLGQGNYLVCCHCEWDRINSPKSCRNGYANVSENRSRQSNIALSDKTLVGGSSRRGSPVENKSQIFRGYDGRTFECPHRRAANLRDEQPLGSTVNSSFERDCRLLSELQNTPSFQSTFQGMSPIPHSPRTYFMFYMTKCKENKGDDDVEVLVEELTQPCPKKTGTREGLVLDVCGEAALSVNITWMGDKYSSLCLKEDSRTKDLTEKMKKIMECPSDSMALRFQKGVSDQCKVPQSSRVLYF